MFKFGAKVINKPNSAKKNVVEMIDKKFSITSTSSLFADNIGKNDYFIVIIQCSKSLAFPSCPVSFLYSLFFSFEV